MKTLSARFEDEVYSAYVLAAEDRGVSFNWLINRVLEESLIKLKDPDQFTVLL